MSTQALHTRVAATPLAPCQATPTRDDWRWAEPRLEQLPRSIQARVRNEWIRRHGCGTRYEANRHLAAVTERFSSHTLPLAADDDEIRSLADRLAARCRRAARRGGLREAQQMAVDRLIEPPRVGPRMTAQGALARLCDTHWWRRKLRTSIGRGAEATLRDQGYVHKRAGIYVSDETVRRIRAQNRRNRALLEALEAVNELGDTQSLIEIADRSVSNPTIRRSELMARVAGFELMANTCGDIAEFYTVTCPSRMHSHHRYGKPNRRYDGTNPRQAQKYLSKQFAKVRSKLAREGLKIYGLRVVEPHHDGTPHWHLLLFVQPHQGEQIREILRHYALQVDRDETGASLHRFRYERIDPKRGSATGYVSKYISKSIDGHGMVADLYGTEATTAAERITAWARCWGIRQFQQIGGPPVSVWRELRRLEDSLEGELEEIRSAADDGDWALFTKRMGGPTASRGKQLLSVWWAHSDKPGKYGEPVGNVIQGVKAGAVVIPSRLHHWRIQRRTRTEAETSLREGSNPAPWSPVNNCTRHALS